MRYNYFVVIENNFTDFEEIIGENFLVEFLKSIDFYVGIRYNVTSQLEEAVTYLLCNGCFF